MERPRIAILASGEGTTAEALVRAAQTDSKLPQVDLVIVSRRDAGIFQRVENLNREFGLQINCVLINSKTHPIVGEELALRGRQTSAEEAAIIELLNAGNFDAIVLLGYMKLNGPALIHAFGWRPEYTSPYQARMLNTHPGLLPDTKGFYGVHVQEHVLELGLTEAGQTLQIAAENYDEGPTIAEHRIPVLPDDTPESLFDRVKVIEKQNIAHDIAKFIEERRKYLSRSVE
jgi:phosphoribosylglycinamide formyltransferase-1